MPVNASNPAVAPLREASAPAPRSRAYRAARRHSGWVRTLKIAIPAGVAVATLLVVAVSLYNPFGRGNLTLGPISISGTKVAMESPRLTGFKKDSRPYEVTARAAYQDIRKPNVIELKDMRARLVMDASGSAANLVAATGLFDTQKEHLELVDDIRVTTDKGEEALLRQASVDFKTGGLVSREPVTITTPGGRIEASAFQVSDNGRMVAFTGHVRALIKRDGEAKADKAGADGASAKYTQAESAERP